jgi:hypothetical protein
MLTTKQNKERNILYKHSVLLLLFISLFCIRVQAQTLIRAADYGIKPNKGMDVTKAVQRLIDVCKSKHKRITLIFEKGQYDLYFNSTSNVEYYITNTSSEDECPSKVKHIGIWLKGINNFTIDAKGALFMLHGKMTSLIADNCKNLTLKNIQFDYERPTMSEFTVVEANEHYTDVKINPSSWYRIKDSVLYWYGENWDAEKKPLRLHTCVYSPVDSALHYGDATWFRKSKRVVELSKNLVRIYHAAKPNATVGDVYTMRDITRDEVGMHFVHCTNVSMDNVQMHFMHGLGIVSQFCTNIHFDHLVCAPRAETGRICSSTADMAHFSTCNGLITVENSFFSGGHDDPINIHSAHLRIVEQLPDNRIVVRFMHPQTYGIQMYEKGDKIDFINHNSLLAYARRVVKDYKRLNEYDIELILTQSVPEKIDTLDCIENATRTPNVLIKNNWFQRTNTRGLLVTTRRKVVIENNTWYKTGMSAILISDDANSWFESGMVKDVLIRNNIFDRCGNMISIAPENPLLVKDKYVHHNIRIIGNLFRLRSNQYEALSARSVYGLDFIQNKIIQNDSFNYDTPKTIVRLNACAYVYIKENKIATELKPQVKIVRMEQNDIQSDWQIVE